MNTGVIVAIGVFLFVCLLLAPTALARRRIRVFIERQMAGKLVSADAIIGGPKSGREGSLSFSVKYRDKNGILHAALVNTAALTDPYFITDEALEAEANRSRTKIEIAEEESALLKRLEKIERGKRANK